MTEDPLGNIQLKEADSYGTGVRNAIPVLGSGAKAFDSAAGAAEDGEVTAGELRGVAAESTGFVQSCMDVGGIVTDPVGWLVGKGLDFLLAVVQPLQDALHFVTGDGPALANAAESFGNIGSGLEELAQQFGEQATTSLANWKGEAAETAGAKLAEFASGIRGTAGEAGNIAQLLQISSMIMTVIEDFLKALITEFVTWLIMIWIPALAAAAPTFGASTAAAGSATGVRAGTTATRASRQVSKLQKLLDKIKSLLDMLKRVFNKTKDVVARIGRSNVAGMAERRSQGFLKSAGGALLDEAKSQVGMPGQPGGPIRPGKPAGTVDNAGKAIEYGTTGDGQSTEETSEQLDF